MYSLAVNNMFRGLIINDVAGSQILLWAVIIKCGFDEQQLCEHNIPFQSLFCFVLGFHYSRFAANKNCNMILQMQNLGVVPCATRFPPTLTLYSQQSENL